MGLIKKRLPWQAMLAIYFFGYVGIGLGLDYVGRHFGWHSLVSSFGLAERITTAVIFSVLMTIFGRKMANKVAKREML